MKYNDVVLDEERVEQMISHAKQYLDDDDMAEIRKNIP